VRCSAPLFDAYLMVDWSAAAVPRRGHDSIWLCHLRREGGERLENIDTRRKARARLLALIAAELRAGRSMLAGFDFPFGYPAGFAARLGLRGPAWRAVWDHLAGALSDGPDNRNNRFAVAARVNEAISTGPAPFWGCPRGACGPFLAMTHHRRQEALGLAEHRLTDARLKGAQPVWKLAGAGAAGSQAITGIPVLRWLRNHPELRRRTRLWPFETGWCVPPRAKRGRAILAEIYPSLVRAPRRLGEVKDKAQVRAIARHFAALDAAGELATLFAGDPDLSAADCRNAQHEEGWILGVTGAAARYTWRRSREANDHIFSP
jgi:precorrin-8X/cobalt-precorrin-8 methylmutase